MPDYLSCGSCPLDFELSDISEFIEHKKWNCSSPSETAQLALNLLECVKCMRRFNTPWPLLIHIQLDHQLHVVRKLNIPQTKYRAPNVEERHRFNDDRGQTLTAPRMGQLMHAETQTEKLAATGEYAENKSSYGAGSALCCSTSQRKYIHDNDCYQQPMGVDKASCFECMEMPKLQCCEAGERPQNNSCCPDQATALTSCFPSYPPPRPKLKSAESQTEMSPSFLMTTEESLLNRNDTTTSPNTSLCLNPISMEIGDSRISVDTVTVGSVNSSNSSSLVSQTPESHTLAPFWDRVPSNNGAMSDQVVFLQPYVNKTDQLTMDQSMTFLLTDFDEQQPTLLQCSENFPPQQLQQGKNIYSTPSAEAPMTTSAMFPNGGTETTGPPDQTGAASAGAVNHEFRFACSQCSKPFRQNVHLKKHIMAQHTKLKPHKCPHCGYTTVEKSHLTVHIRTHTGEKPFRCRNCHYSSAQNCTLKSHYLRRHPGSLVLCRNCGEAYVTEQEKKNHEKACVSNI